jgi:hypothetical protein
MNRVAADLPAAPQLILIRSPGPAFGPGLARPRYRFRLEARALGAALQTLAVDDKRASRATPESLSHIAQSAGAGISTAVPWRLVPTSGCRATPRRSLRLSKPGTRSSEQPCSEAVCFDAFGIAYLL